MTRVYAAFVALVAGPDRAHAPGEGPLYHGLQGAARMLYEDGERGLQAVLFPVDEEG